jgi:hypothetical protein
MCIKWFKSLFKSPEEKKHALGMTDSELASKLYGEDGSAKPPRKARVDTYDGINMPKAQPCPDCRAHSRRLERLPGGARYLCRTHGLFFVPASRRARGY